LNDMWRLGVMLRDLATGLDVSGSCHGKSTHPTASSFTCHPRTDASRPGCCPSAARTPKAEGHLGRRRLVRCHPQTGPPRPCPALLPVSRTSDDGTSSSSPAIARFRVRRNLLVGRCLVLRPTRSGRCPQPCHPQTGIFRPSCCPSREGVLRGRCPVIFCLRASGNCGE
jgi:hypothetical protein